MATITVGTLTPDQVTSLETEAAQAGDVAMVEHCRTVLDHWNRTVLQRRSNKSSLSRVLRALNDAAAQS